MIFEVIPQHSFYFPLHKLWKPKLYYYYPVAVLQRYHFTHSSKTRYGDFNIETQLVLLSRLVYTVWTEWVQSKTLNTNMSAMYFTDLCYFIKFIWRTLVATLYQQPLNQWKACHTFLLHLLNHHQKRLKYYRGILYTILSHSAVTMAL